MLKDLCIEIIEKCPNNCMFCSSCSNIDKDMIIQFEDFKRVVDYFYSNYGIGELSISGGEPFMHQDLYEMIKYSKSLGIKTVLFTSGIKYRRELTTEEKELLKRKRDLDIEEVKLHEPWNKRLINNIYNYYDKCINQDKFSGLTREDIYFLQEIGLDKIVFDFQGYGEEHDSKIMGRRKTFYEYLLNSLLNASLSQIETDVHFVPMKNNYRDLPEIVDLLNIANIDNLSVLKFVPQGRGRVNSCELEMTSEESDELSVIIDTCKEKFNGLIRTSIPLNNQVEHKCNAGLSKLDIKFDGTILPCAALKELTKEQQEMYGIKLFNIYESLEQVKIYDSVRDKPLCKRIYKN